jgi:predicted transcriptional regulator
VECNNGEKQNEDSENIEKMVSDFVDNKIEDDENDEELETPRM